MRHEIAYVEPGGIADQLGIAVGDRLVSINGREIADFIDYQAFTCAEKLTLLTARENEEIEYELEKDEYEPLGLRFAAFLMSPERQCANKCLFCFEDQLPPGSRDSLHAKDDDWRLSLMMGNFVTLTNVSDKELARIIERNASPLYVSVHATNASVRERLLGNPRAGRLMSQLNRLAAAGLCFHAQAVLCPGINDGDVLKETVMELAALRPACLSLALVPVGLTAHRDGLEPLRGFDKAGAEAVVDAVARWQKKYRAKDGEGFVYAADELYLKAERPLPSAESYDGYPQIENGVGLLRLFEEEYAEAWEDARPIRVKPARYAVACGVSFAPFLRDVLKKRPIPGVEVEVVAVANAYFGESVTVSGLLTGGDIVREMAGTTADKVLITECMLREGEDVFLDGMTLSEASARIGAPVQPVGRKGDALLRALLGDNREDE